MEPPSKDETATQKNPRYSHYLSFDKQAIRTNPFRKISLLRVPCPQNFIPGVNRGELTHRTPSVSQPPARRLSSVCYQGIFVNTRGTPSDTQKGLLQAGLVALTFPAPSKHTTCFEHVRPKRAMTHGSSPREPVTVAEKIDRAIELSSQKLSRRYTVPLLLDLYDMPESLFELLVQYNGDTVVDVEPTPSVEDQLSASVDESRLRNKEKHIPVYSRHSSLPDIYSSVKQGETYTLSERSDTADALSFGLDDEKTRSDSVPESGLHKGRASVKMLPKASLNSLKFSDSISVAASSLPRVRAASKTHYATRSFREMTIRYGTLVFSGSRDFKLYQELTSKNINQGQATAALPQNDRKDNVEKIETRRSQGEHNDNPLSSVNSKTDDELMLSQNHAGKTVRRFAEERTSRSKEGSPVKESKQSGISISTPLRKVSHMTHIDSPRSEEEKETFNIIQSAMRSKLPKTFRTTVKMGLFADPVVMLETHSKKGANIANKLKRKQNSRRSNSLTPHDNEVHERWKRRSNTNPDLEFPLPSEDTAVRKSTDPQSRTFPRISKEDKEAKRFDMFSIFRPKVLKKLVKHDLADFSNLDLPIRSDANKRPKNGKEAHEPLQKSISSEGHKKMVIGKPELNSSLSLDASRKYKTIPLNDSAFLLKNGKRIDANSIFLNEMRKRKGEELSQGITGDNADDLSQRNQKNSDLSLSSSAESDTSCDLASTESREKEEDELNKLMQELEGYMQEIEDSA